MLRIYGADELRVDQEWYDLVPTADGNWLINT